MGVVFRARDTDLGRDVALKCPWPHLATDPKYGERFLREARITAGLSHPNIVPLYEAFELHGVLWLVMQLVHGQNLSDLVRTGGPMPPERVARYARELTSALEYAHAAGVLHRDITPRNILVGSDGRAQLTDFGLARVTETGDGEAGLANPSQSFVGTPNYMPAEQIFGRKLDARSDLYSLGAVLYEAITGERAFPGNEPEPLIDQILHHDPATLDQVDGVKVPAGLQKIVSRCLARHPDDRYPDASELKRDIERLLAEIGGGHAGPGERLRWTAAIVVALTLGTAGIAILFRRPEPGFDLRGVGEPARITRGFAWEGEAAISPDGRRVAYTSNPGSNRDIYIADASGGAPLRLTEHAAADSDPTWFPDGKSILFTSDRGSAPDLWRAPVDGGAAELLVPDARHAAVSPDGRRIAFSRFDESGFLRIHVAPLDAVDQAVSLTGDDDGLWGHTHPTWSPDGESVAYQSLASLWIVPASGGTARPLIPDGGTSRIEPVWSPRGSRIYYTSFQDGTTSIWSVAPEGGEPTRVTQGIGQERHPSVSADGSRLAYSTNDQRMHMVLFDRSSGERTRIQRLGGSMMPAISAAQDRVVVVADWTGRLNLWVSEFANGDIVGQPKPVLEQPIGNPSQPAFSPDGRWIAYYLIRDDERHIWIVSSDGGEPIRFTDSGSANITPSWSPDGRSIAFASDAGGESVLWVAPVRNGRRDGEPRQLTRGGNDYAPAWAPDGQAIAFMRIDNAASNIWLVPADGSAPARQVTTDHRGIRVRWIDNDTLIAAGTWDQSRVTYREISREGFEFRVPEVRPSLTDDAMQAMFDVTSDGRLLLFPEEETVGDVWVLDLEQP